MPYFKAFDMMNIEYAIWNKNLVKSSWASSLYSLVANYILKNKLNTKFVAYSCFSSNSICSSVCSSGLLFTLSLSYKGTILCFQWIKANNRDVAPSKIRTTLKTYLAFPSYPCNIISEIMSCKEFKRFVYICRFTP